MRKLIFVFILISFGFSFAGWIHYFPQVIYGLNTDQFSYKLCAHKITTVDDDIIIVFTRGTNPLSAFTRLIRMDKHGRVTDDVLLGQYSRDTIVYIVPMGLERGPGSYLELYYYGYYCRPGSSGVGDFGVLYLDSSLTVIDKLTFDYHWHYQNGDICRVDSSYVVLSSGGEVGRIDFDGDTIWHLDTIDGLSYFWEGSRVAISPDKEFAFLLLDSIRGDDIHTKIVKLDLDSGTVLWVKWGLSVIFDPYFSKNYFALYPTPDGGLLHYVREKYFGYWQHIHYYDPSGRECWVLPERDYDHFIFWCFTHIDSNLYWAGGAFRHGGDFDYDSTFAAIAKVRLEDSTFRFNYMKTFPIHGFVEKIIPFDDSLIIAGIGDASFGEYSNFYFVMKTDTLGNTGISENHFPLPASPKIAVCPNPFNKACRITYPYDEKWSVKIYNTKGRLVYESGEISGKSFVWQPQDNVQSGLYIVVAGNEKRKLAGKVFFVK